MAFSAPTTAPQINWEATESVEAFRKFRKKCELMFKSILKEIAKEEQVNYLLLWVGEQGRDMYNSWAFEDEDERKDPAKILDRFMEHLEPRTNHRPIDTLFKVYDKIKVSQSITLSLRLRISQPNDSKDRILDQLIWGSNNPEVQKSLTVRDEKLSINNAIDIARSNEASKRQMNSLLSRNIGQSQRVDSINHKKFNPDKTESNFIQCKKCGTSHNLPHKNNCPVYGTTCKKCGKLNHWQSVCRSVKPRPRSKSPRRMKQKTNS